MSLETRVDEHLNKLLEGSFNKEQTTELIAQEFYAFLCAVKKRQLEALKEFGETFEEKQGIKPTALDFKAVIELIKYYEIKEFHLIDNVDSSLEEFLEA